MEEQVWTREEIKGKIKNILNAEGSAYTIKIQHPETGKCRAGPSVPRSRHVEDMCYDLKQLWPLMLYAGVVTAESDPDNLMQKTATRVLSCITEVIVGLLNSSKNPGAPEISLANIEKVLRRGQSQTHIIARKVARTATVVPIFQDIHGNEKEWYYDIGYGFDVIIKRQYEINDCENSIENMKRLENAGHIWLNASEWLESRKKERKGMALGPIPPPSSPFSVTATSTCRIEEIDNE